MIVRPNFKRYIAWESLAAAGASLLGAGASVAGQANLNRKNRKFAEEQSEKQRQYSTEMWEKQNAWNEQMWNAENAYNTPSAQVDRLRDAGLNPLFYGVDGSNAGDLTAAQPLGYDQASLQGQINPMAGLGDAALKAAQVANIQAQTEKTKTETGAIEAKLPFEVEELKNQIRNSKLSADAQETINKYIDQQQEAELRVKYSTAAEADAMVQKMGAEIEKMDYEKTTMFISWIETNEKILTLQKNRELTDKQMEELSSLIAVNNANAKKIGLDVSNYDDITVIGTASHNIKMGPISVQEGQPITLAMKKAAEAHADQLKEEAKKNKRSADGQVSTADGSPYSGPVYD